MDFRCRARTSILIAALLFATNTSVHANPLVEIKPGESTRADMEALLGAPSGAGALSRYSASAAGLSEVVAGYDKAGVLEWARVALVKQLSPDIAVLLFDNLGAVAIETGNGLGGDTEQGRTEHYREAGVHFYVSGDVVREIWLVRPGADVAAVARAAGAPPVAAGSVAGVPETGVLRRLQVSAVWCEYVADEGGIASLNVYATVETEGLKDKLLTMRYVLIDPSGTIIKTSAGKPFSGGFADTVLYDNSKWAKATGTVDLRGLSTGGVHQARLRWEALLPDMGACSETMVALDAAGEGAAGTVTVSNVRGEAGGSGGADGIWLYADVTANGCTGKVLRGWAAMRTSSGIVKSKQKDYANGEGALSAGSQDTVKYDTASWTPFKLFIPYAAFDLPGGKKHRVMITYMAACEGVGSRAEQEVYIDVP